MSQFDRNLTGFRFAETYHGDTLQRIAARELGDAERWTELAHLNNLVPPYFAEPSEPAADGILRYGDMIMIPSAVTFGTAQTDPNLVFEIDCSLSNGLLTGNGSGDFSVVAGRDNLKQALKHRIMTPRGDLVFHTDYRCLVHELIGTVNGPAAGLLGGEYVKAALQADNRVDSVNRTSVTITGDKIEISAEITPIVGKPIVLEV